jgi:uncharacterized phage protein gp47/JayE
MAETYETILARMMSKVSGDIDKREGSVIYNALAPAAAEIAEMELELDSFLDLVFADTAAGDYLSRKTAEYGVTRESATAAVRKGTFTFTGDATDIALNSRFSCGGLVFDITEKIDDATYELTCETLGTAGNNPTGTMLPIDYVDGLKSATMSDILIPGEDEETDDSLRSRFYDEINTPAFGGNIMAYKKFCREFDGVGDAKIVRATDLNLPGHVGVYIVDSNFKIPSDTLVSNLQEYLDPTVNSGNGFGVVPIGHTATVYKASPRTIDVSANIVVTQGAAGDYEAAISTQIDGYLSTLRENWGNVDISSGILDYNTSITVRVSQILNAILQVSGVEDASNITINGLSENVTLEFNELPYVGTISVADAGA